MYTTTIKAEFWSQCQQHVTEVYTEGTYVFDHDKYQVSFTGLPMLDSFVSNCGLWLAV